MFKQRMLYWTPRILSLLLVLFFLLFTLEGIDRWQDGVMHFLFALPFIIITILAWTRPKIGGIIYMVLGGLFIILLNEEWTSTIIWVVIFLTGLLFYLSIKNSAKNKSR